MADGFSYACQPGPGGKSFSGMTMPAVLPARQDRGADARRPSLPSVCDPLHMSRRNRSALDGAYRPPNSRAPHSQDLTAQIPAMSVIQGLTPPSAIHVDLMN